MEEALVLAIIFNVMLLVIAYYSRSTAAVIVSSLIWILIGFECYTTYSDTLLLGVLYMIAFVQIFPVHEKTR